MCRARMVLLPLALAAILLASSIFREAMHAQVNSQVWPTKEWQTSPPEDQGMDSAKLAELVEIGVYTGIDSILIARRGKIVVDAYYAPFGPGIKHRMYSVTKSVLGTLIAIAVKDGLLDSVDRRFIDLFREHRSAKIDDYKKSITIQNLLDMTSGLDWTAESFAEMRHSQDWIQYVLDGPMVEPPGLRFQYNEVNADLLSAIITKISGDSALDYARKHLFGPLGIADVVWNSDPHGNTDGGDGLYLQPRDMAKIGYLYLRNGIWDSNQIVSADWIDKVAHASIDAHIRSAPELRYANLFWAIPNKRIYAAQGHHGQYVIVMPALDIVVVITGTRDHSIEKWVGYIADCVKSDAPLPANPTAVSLLSSRVQYAATERPSSVGDVPPTAKVISGKIYYFADNSLQLKSISVNLSDPNPSYEYQVKTGRSTAPLARFTGPISVDGVFRLGLPTSQGISAAKGAWIDENTFVGHIQTLGNDDAREVILTFEGTGVDLSVEDADGSMTLLHGETKG